MKEVRVRIQAQVQVMSRLMSACGSLSRWRLPRDILEWTHVIFGSVKEGILELLYGCLGAFQAEIVAGQLGTHLEPNAG